MPPNVLLVVLDTARRDVVEPYGAPAGSTPAIAQLARRGSALRSAYATANWTIPSHASIFTGLLPREVGLTRAPGGTAPGAKPLVEAQRERLLPEVLRRAGYETRGLSTNLWVSPHSGFDLGFDEFQYRPTSRVNDAGALHGAGRRQTLAWVREGMRARVDDGAAETGTALRHMIGDWSGNPTFWFVNLVECHSPYLPPRPWNDLPPWDRARAALESKRFHNLLAILLYVGGRLEIPEPAFERMRHLYARAVGYMDEWLAGVLEALDGRGILDETLVIVTSDHGEHLGEDRLFGHGFSLDEQLVRVPLVMAGPGTLDTDRAVSLAELPRIIAAAAGVEGHPWVEENLGAGVAFAQYDAMPRERLEELAKQWDISDEGLERLSPRFSAASDGRLKLVVRNGEELVYDLEADPGETAPLADADPKALRSALSAAEPDEAPVAAAQPAPDTPSPEELAELERQMKLLGYL
ncbi:MAG TPA: sulfatase [Thermoleophilaceae bacterium]